MRHRKSFNHLGRKPAHRKAMLSNMAVSLILHKRITTTTAKAKALRSYVEPLLTKAKDDTTHSRRVVFSYLQDKDAVSELFREVSPKIADRPGGYTRILKIGNRPGDNADMAIIELVDYNENLVSQKPVGKSAGKRRRRGGSKTAAPVAVADTTVEEADVTETAEDISTTDTSTDTAEEVIEDKVVEEVAEEVVEISTAEEVAEDAVEEGIAEEEVEDKVEEVSAEAASEETAEPEAEEESGDSETEEIKEDTDEEGETEKEK